MRALKKMLYGFSAGISVLAFFSSPNEAILSQLEHTSEIQRDGLIFALATFLAIFLKPIKKIRRLITLGRFHRSDSASSNTTGHTVGKNTCTSENTHDGQLKVSFEVSTSTNTNLQKANGIMNRTIDAKLALPRGPVSVQLTICLGNEDPAQFRQTADPQQPVIDHIRAHPEQLAELRQEAEELLHLSTQMDPSGAADYIKTARALLEDTFEVRKAAAVTNSERSTASPRRRASVKTKKHATKRVRKPR